MSASSLSLSCRAVHRMSRKTTTTATVVSCRPVIKRSDSRELREDPRLVAAVSAITLNARELRAMQCEYNARIRRKRMVRAGLCSYIMRLTADRRSSHSGCKPRARALGSYSITRRSIATTLYYSRCSRSAKYCGICTRCGRDSDLLDAEADAWNQLSEQRYCVHRRHTDSAAYTVASLRNFILYCADGLPNCCFDHVCTPMLHILRGYHACTKKFQPCSCYHPTALGGVEG